MSNMRKAAVNAIMLRSKTVNVNVVAGAAVAILQQFGLVLDAGLVTAILALANVVLRFITDSPLEDKVGKEEPIEYDKIRINK